jgi:hypothetical protein
MAVVRLCLFVSVFVVVLLPCFACGLPLVLSCTRTHTDMATNQRVPDSSTNLHDALVMDSQDAINDEPIQIQNRLHALFRLHVWHGEPHPTNSLTLSLSTSCTPLHARV